MSDSYPFLFLEQPCDDAIDWVIHQVSGVGLQVMRTFDLQAARHDPADCPCPHHGTEQCDCQMVVLLVYGLAAELLGGMAAITGTFIAGMMFARTPHKENVESGLRADVVASRTAVRPPRWCDGADSRPRGKGSLAPAWGNTQRSEAGHTWLQEDERSPGGGCDLAAAQDQGEGDDGHVVEVGAPAQDLGARRRLAARLDDSVVDLVGDAQGDVVQAIQHAVAAEIIHFKCQFFR